MVLNEGNHVVVHHFPLLLEREHQTVLTDAVNHAGNPGRFLGYDISISRSRETKRLKNCNISRVYYGVVNLYVPFDKWSAKLRELKAIRIVKDAANQEHWKAIHRGKLIVQTLKFFGNTTRRCAVL